MNVYLILSLFLNSVFRVVLFLFISMTIMAFILGAHRIFLLLEANILPSDVRVRKAVSDYILIRGTPGARRHCLDPMLFLWKPDFNITVVCWQTDLLGIHLKQLANVLGAIPRDVPVVCSEL